jgi:hypothetical protein
VRFIAIHHNAEQRHIGRRRRRRRWLRRDEDRWGRRQRPARGREQRTLARRRQAIKRLRGQRTWESSALLPSLRWKRGRLARFVHKSRRLRRSSVKERAERRRPRRRRVGRGLRRRIGRRNGGWRKRQQHHDRHGTKQGHAAPRRQLARSPSVTRNSGSSTAR